MVNPTAISIAQGDNTKSIEATPVLTAATGSWYAVVDGEYYRIYIPEGKKQVKIDRTATNITGEGATQQVTFTSSNNKVLFNSTGTTTATVECNAQGKAIALITVGEDAINSATITASAGSETADCVVTVLKNVSVTVQSDDTTKGISTTITGVKYLEGSTVELTATVTDNDFQFAGWYETKNGGIETKISESATYSYVVPTDGTTSVTIIGKFEEKPKPFSTSTSAVGYYADLNNDKIIDEDNDGIIFVDLARTQKSTGGMGSYSYTPITNNLKEYVTGTTVYKNTTISYLKLTENSVGNASLMDRFYVLGLKNLGSYYWYYKASVTGSPTSTAFGTGKLNTETMIDRWYNNSESGDGTYGAKNNNDMWKWVKQKREAVAASSASNRPVWFVPSRDEWSAVSGELTSDILTTLGLDYTFWSSSVSSSTYVYCPNFNYWGIRYGSMNSMNPVRLATTF